MWTKLKALSRHPHPVIRKYAKHLMHEMNKGNRNYVEIKTFVNKYYHETQNHDNTKILHP
jgi:hypothetical protein